MSLTYELITLREQHGIKCLRCGMTSFHPIDIANRYCGRCHIFHEDLALIERDARLRRIAYECNRDMIGAEAANAFARARFGDREAARIIAGEPPYCAG